MISILPESNYAAVMTETVEPYLDSRRQEMDMPLSTGGTLHAEVYEQPDATRAVVILHGYTESAEKFREMTWYFLNEKFNVYAIDHRGHGKSVRKISDTSITHVDAFSDYLRDLEEFMSGVVLPRTEHLPRVLYAHSMGGAIGGMQTRGGLHVRHRQTGRPRVHRQTVQPGERAVRDILRHQPRPL